MRAASDLHYAVFIRVQTDEEAKLFESQIPTIITLTKNGKSAKVIRDVSEVPEGCGSVVITPTIVEYMVVRVRDFCHSSFSVREILTHIHDTGPHRH